MGKKQKKKRKRQYNPSKRKRLLTPPQQKGTTLATQLAEFNKLKPALQAAIEAKRRAREKDGGNQHDTKTDI